MPEKNYLKLVNELNYAEISIVMQVIGKELILYKLLISFILQQIVLIFMKTVTFMYQIQKIDKMLYMVEIVIVVMKVTIHL